MSVNESNDGQDLALNLKKEFEKKIKEVMEKLKEGETTISQEGIQLTLTKGQYIMSVHGIPVAIIAKTGKDSYDFNYNLNNIKELEELLKQNEEEFKLLPQLKQIAELGKQEKHKEHEREEDARDTLENDTKEKEDKPDEDKKQEEKKTEEVSGKNVKMDSTAMEIPGDKKIGETYTFSTKMQEHYNKGKNVLEGNERFFVKADENDRYNFRLYAMKTDGTVIELPTRSRIEGKNAREEQIVVSSKDGTKLEQKQPLQIMMLNNDFGFAMFGEGDRYREFTAITRDQDDNYKGHVLCKNGEENEFKDGSYKVREQTGESLRQRANGDDGEPDYDVFIKLNELEKEGLVKKNDINLENTENVNSSIDITTKGLMERYGFDEATAKNVGNLIFLEKMDVKDAVYEGYKESEKRGKIPPGSADYLYEHRGDNEGNGKENGVDRVPGPRNRFYE